MAEIKVLLRVLRESEVLPELRESWISASANSEKPVEEFWHFTRISPGQFMLELYEEHQT